MTAILSNAWIGENPERHWGNFVKHNLESLTNPSDPFLRFSSPTPQPPLSTQAGQQGGEKFGSENTKKIYVCDLLPQLWPASSTSSTNSIGVEKNIYEDFWRITDPIETGRLVFLGQASSAALL